MKQLIFFTVITTFLLAINHQIGNCYSLQDSTIQENLEVLPESKFKVNQTSRFMKVTASTEVLAKRFVSDNYKVDEDFLFANDKIEVSQVYPNPASVSATIDYKLNDTKLDAKITVTNLLGREIARYNLLRDNRQIRIPTIKYDAGIYFYRLYINGKVVKAKKLVVKHN